MADLGVTAKAALPYLLELLSEEDSYLRRYAAWSIGEIGLANDPIVVHALLDHGRRHPDEEVRLSALRALMHPEAAYSPEFARVLCRIYRSDPEHSIRRQALRALGGGATLSAVGAELFVELIRDDEHAREAVLALRPGIFIADETLAGLLLGIGLGRRTICAKGRVPAGTLGPLDVAKRARQMLGYVIGPAGREVVQALIDTGSTSHEILDPLVRLGPGHFELFVTALRCNGSAQGVVLHALAWASPSDAASWMDPAVVPELVRIFRATEKDQQNERRAILNALFNVASVADRAYAAQEMLPLALGALHCSDHPDWVRERAARAIGQIGPIAAQAAVPLLLDLLPALGQRVKETTLMALGQLGDPQAIPTLEQALGDRADVQVAALRALREFGPRAARSVSKIAPLLQHDYTRVRLEAVATVQAIGPAAAAAAGPLADLLEPKRQRAYDMNEGLHERAREALKVIVGDRNAKEEEDPKKTQVTDPASPR